jgi:hypothetical protein
VSRYRKGHASTARYWGVKAPGRELEDGLDRLPRYRELFHYLVDGHAVFEVLKETTATGVRVPLNTQAPLTFPGTLSTAAHSDQSSAAMDRPPSGSSF